MSQTHEPIDELFGQHGQPQPRTRRITALLVAGLVLSVLGLACTTVPGGVLVLLAWSAVERELDRVDSGYLALEHKPRLVVLERVTWVAVALIALLFLGQGVMFCSGFYTPLWSWYLDLLGLPPYEGPIPVMP